MPQQISKKILVYFFLFIIFGSLNNKNLAQLKFPNIKKIKIEGLEVENKELQKSLDLFKMKTLFNLDKLKVSELLNSNNLIEEYVISKRYPSSLEIRIIETELLALLNKRGKSFYIGSNGKLIEAEDVVKNLPYIFGDPNIERFLSLKRMIDSSKLDYNDIENLFFFPSGRWDIETSSGVLIKLPIKNTEESLELALNLLDYKQFDNIKSIDARPRNQVITYE
ncbi:FtsQ-type POTRA domain-containing protein [Pelagibacterales bacterium SAG-MED12]|nr:FtsQ-type POTRA domain-containing protein [Pelagibacterales bacterium SAG-MED12]